MISYQVQEGENLSGILSRHSKLFGFVPQSIVNFQDDILKLNKIKDPNKIYAGETIKLPKSSDDFKFLIQRRLTGKSEAELMMPPPVPAPAPPVEMPIIKPSASTTEVKIIEPESLIRGVTNSFQSSRKLNAIRKPYYEPGLPLPTPTVSEHQSLLNDVEYQAREIARSLKGKMRQKALDQVTSEMYNAYKMKDPYLFSALKMTKRILNETWGIESI